MKHLILLPLLAFNSFVLGARDDTPTVTLTRTHHYCPCDDSTKLADWQTWEGWTTSRYSTSKSTYSTSSSTTPSTTTASATLTTTTSASTTSETTTTTTTTSSSTTSQTTTTTTTTSSSTTSESTTTTTSATPTTTACTNIGADSPSTTRDQFINAGVVPTLIPDIQPRLDVFVSYNGKAVSLGNEFTIPETTLQPDLTFNAEEGIDSDATTYSYFLIDPDVPNPDAGALRMTFLHWYVAGAKSLCARTPATNQQTVASYQALTPASVQQHRYTFLVFREPAGYTPDVIAAQVRVGFDINTYAAGKNLVLVGGNFLKEAALNGVITTSATTTTTTATTTTTSEQDLPTL